MIITLIIIALAFAWLLKETDFLRIRLESTECQRAKLARDKANTESDNKTSYKLSVFVELDMPELDGTLNIICERG